MAPKPDSPRFYNVVLRTPEEKERWKLLAKMDMVPSRYPDEDTLHRLGIRQCFNELCAVGGLTNIFGTCAPSYRGLTLEFLSTLEVHMASHGIVHYASFRIRNVEVDAHLAEMQSVWGCYSQNVSKPEEYDPATFWYQICLPMEAGEQYQTNRMKITSIRNPALRYLAKSLAHSVFGRSETGNLISDELFVLWSILKGRPLNIGHFIVKYLERQSKKRQGGLGCGGVITMLALNQFAGVIPGLEPMPEEPRIDREFLLGAKFWKMDRRRQGYILQRLKDDFPVPDPQNTYVCGFHYRDNWLMNTPVHQEIIRSRPHGQYTTKWEHPDIPQHMPIPVLPPQYLDPPHGDVPMLTMGVEPPFSAAEMDPDAYMEEAYADLRAQQAAEIERRRNRGEGSSRGHGHGEGSSRGRSRDEGDQNYERLAQRMERVEIGLSDLRQTQNSFFTRLTTQTDAHWTAMNQRMDAQEANQTEIRDLLRSFKANNPDFFQNQPPPSM